MQNWGYVVKIGIILSDLGFAQNFRDEVTIANISANIPQGLLKWYDFTGMSLTVRPSDCIIVEKLLQHYLDLKFYSTAYEHTKI